ncbi:DUF1990 family protein [Streptomyces noursei]|uniref:DUF1990 family protein n=1 Tax=Streptomyces noursei TaxID=1971 RepID=UPI001962F285|nr:DUF1990 domain-containing protein [Streptomyces noursei]QRX96158.1 DUF1990 domain-containing protein [Streptomyces noursei]
MTDGDLTYPERGGTRRSPLPPGYRPLREAVRLGHGRAVFAAAGDAVAGFRMHRAAGTRIRADAPRAAPGVAVDVSVGLGPLRVTGPCRVVWTVETADRAGFGYGSRPGHPVCGEEAFVVVHRPDGSVWLVVTAFSRPARPLARLAGPLLPLFQRAYVRHLGRTLRRLVRRADDHH